MRKLSTAIQVSTIAAGAMLLGIGTGAANAATFVSTSNGDFGTVNATTGAFTSVVTDAPVFFDIALSPTNQLVGVTGAGQFYSIDAVANSVASLGNGGIFLNALGYASNGNLYGAGGSGFYQINLGGAAPVVSLLANIAGFNSAGDIVFDPTNNRFLATSTAAANSTLYGISLTGAGSAIGAIGFSNVYGLAFSEDGSQLFGYTANREQITVNAATGAGIFDQAVTGVRGNLNGAASSPNSAAVPEPTTMLGLLVAGGLGAALKRRQGQQAE